eukprot:gene18308-23994_t
MANTTITMQRYEFRAFISVKPDAIFADLSIETCRSPPCIGPNHIDNFNW